VRQLCTSQSSAFGEQGPRPCDREHGPIMKSQGRYACWLRWMMGDKDVALVFMGESGWHVGLTIGENAPESFAGVGFAQLSRNGQRSFAHSQKSRLERGRLGALFPAVLARRRKARMCGSGVTLHACGHAPWRMPCKRVRIEFLMLYGVHEDHSAWNAGHLRGLVPSARGPILRATPFARSKSITLRSSSPSSSHIRCASSRDRCCTVAE
jgi:hypothetical protein